MRVFLPGLLLLAATSLIFAQNVTVAPVTTAPAASEVDQLRAQIKALQEENERLRAQLAAVTAGGAPAAASEAATSKADAPESVLAGIEGLLQGFPKQQMPGANDADGSLRHTLLMKWAKEHGVGHLITLHARFADASGLQGHQFTVRVGSGVSRTIPHPFEVTAALPESEAPRVLAFHRWSWVVIAGRIKSINVSRDGDGNFITQMELESAVITADPTRGF